MFLFPVLVGLVIAHPLTDPRTWISTSDFPGSALAAEAEGVAQVALSVDQTGKPVACDVKISSGNAALDTTTCRLLQEQAKFRPVRDAAGRPSSAVFMQRVRWAIPRDQLINQGFRMTFDLDAAGNPTSCRIKEFGNHDPDLRCDSQGVRELAEFALSKPLAAYSQFSFLLAQQIEKSDISFIRQEGGEQHTLVRARIEVSPDGAIKGCVSEKEIEYRGKKLDLCDGGFLPVGRKEFAPDSTGKARLFDAFLEISGWSR